MLVDGFDHRAEHREEDGVFMRVAPGVEEVLPAVGDGPVVVFPGSVDAGVRLFVEEALEIVLFGDFFESVHHEHVVVAREVQLLELRGEFELRGRDFVVARLCGDAELPQFALDVVHEGKYPVGYRAEIVVFKLLALRGRRPEERPAREHQVGALLPVFFVDEEIFLLRAERASHVRIGPCEEAHQTLHGFFERLHRAEKGCLLVECFAGICAECGRDAQGCAVRVALDERGTRRVPRRVAARLESGADAAGREGARVGLADDEVLPAELHDRLAVFYFQERIVLFGGRARHRKKPVSVVGGAAVHRPVAYAVRHLVCDRRVERASLADRRLQFLRGVLAQICPYGLVAEHVLAEPCRSLCFVRHFPDFLSVARHHHDASPSQLS